MRNKKIQSLVNQAQSYNPEPPRPLRREPPPSDPYPIDCLGDVLGSAAQGIQDVVQCPVAIAAQSVLAGASLAVQGHADVELPTGATRPVSSYFITVAESGERKTSADDNAIQAILAYEDRLRAEYEVNKQKYQDELELYQVERNRIVKGKKMSREQRRGHLAALGDEPQTPLQPIVLVQEPTAEGLIKLMRQGQPSLGLFSGEGASFLAGHAMSEDNRLKTSAWLSKLWDGAKLTRVRQGDPPSAIVGRRLALHLMVQPGVAATLLADERIRDQGLLSRLLVVAPESMAGLRLWKEPKAASKRTIEAYDRQLSGLLQAPLPLAEGSLNELRPRSLDMSPGASEMWKQFVDDVERKLGPGGSYKPIQGLANKLPEHAARLAATLELFRDLDAPEVSSEAFVAGMELAMHYASEMLRMAGSRPSRWCTSIVAHR